MPPHRFSSRCSGRLAILLLAWALFAAPSVSRAGEVAVDPLTRITISSSPSPVGSGARAAGMGNAFVAVADDATAASWNPAGLVQLLKPEISVVGLARAHRESRRSAQPAAATDDAWEDLEANFASFVYPFAIGRMNGAVAVNYQQAYDFDRAVHLGFSRHAEAGGAGPVLRQTLDVRSVQRMEQDGRLGAAGIGLALEPHPSLLVGLNLNLWHEGLVAGNSWSRTERVESDITVTTITTGGVSTRSFRQVREETQHRRLSRGVNLHAGVLWNLHRKWTLGAVVKTPLRAHLRARTVGRTVQSTGALSTWDRTESEVLEFPCSAGVGLAYRRSDALTFSLDATWTAWDDFVLEQADGDRISPVSGAPLSESGVGSTTAVRLGAEYLWIQDTTRVIPFRAGVFYDPEPAPDGHRDAWGASIGTGLILRNLSLDAAYTYRWTKSGELPGLEATASRERRHLVMLSAILYF
jgi:long-subunit fatty acid transport protein